MAVEGDRLAAGRALNRRGGFHIRPGVFAPPRGSRDDASIVPYTGLQRRRVVVSRLDGRLPWFVGEGHGPPANPCAAAISRFTAAFSPAP